MASFLEPTSRRPEGYVPPSRPATPGRRTPRWLPWAAVIVTGVVLAAIVITRGDSDSPAFAGGEIAGQPEVITAESPAHVQEAIIFGEADAQAALVASAPLPVHVIEGIIFGEVDPTVSP
jgi:hypothetical protein